MSSLWVGVLVCTRPLTLCLVSLPLRLGGLGPGAGQAGLLHLCGVTSRSSVFWDRLGQMAIISFRSSASICCLSAPPAMWAQRGPDCLPGRLLVSGAAAKPAAPALESWFPWVPELSGAEPRGGMTMGALVLSRDRAVEWLCGGQSNTGASGGAGWPRWKPDSHLPTVRLRC